jgi:flagellar biosynthesis protein FlhG
VPYDDYLRRAIRRQTTVVEAFPSSPSARELTRLAAAAAGWSPKAGARGGIEFFMERMLRPSAPLMETAAG